LLVPKLSLGSMFSSSCWAVSDHLLYGVHYMHMGEPRRWYSVPAEEGKRYEVRQGWRFRAVGVWVVTTVGVFVVCCSVPGRVFLQCACRGGQALRGEAGLWVFVAYCGMPAYECSYVCSVPAEEGKRNEVRKGFRALGFMIGLESKVLSLSSCQAWAACMTDPTGCSCPAPA
jgi:hypothetical protein